MYLSVDGAGSSYHIINNATKVSIKGKLVDLRSGKVLWEGKRQAAESRNNSNLFRILITAAVGNLFYLGDKGGGVKWGLLSETKAIISPFITTPYKAADFADFFANSAACLMKLRLFRFQTLKCQHSAFNFA